MFEATYQFIFFDGAKSCFASLTCTCLQGQVEGWGKGFERQVGEDRDAAPLW